MFSRYRAMRRTDPERFGHEGFTLIELLIVIIIMGILAAVVVFALGGVTASSAQAACNTDAKTLDVAVQAYESTNGGAYPPSIASLTTGTNAALRSWPNNDTHYYVGIVLSGATVVTYETTGGTVSIVPTTGSMTGASQGQVWIANTKTDAGAAVAANWTNYDASVTAGSNVCSNVS